MANPQGADPTRTTGLRARYMADMGRRVLMARRAVRAQIVTDDAFGLRLNAEREWEFQSDPAKVESFRAWLEDQFALGLLYTDGAFSLPWANKYIFSAYKAGVLRAWLDANPPALEPNEFFAKGKMAQFLETTFGSAITTERLQLLYTRNFENLKGITGEMASKLSIILADGLAHGYGPSRIASKMVKGIDGISRKRAMVLARTEIIYAFAEGQLDAFEELGIDRVGAMVELATAGDERVCPICAALNGTIYTIEEARGVIPVHPNCRCAWIPYLMAIHRHGRRARAAT